MLLHSVYCVCVRARVRACRGGFAAGTNMQIHLQRREVIDLGIFIRVCTYEIIILSDNCELPLAVAEVTDDSC
jgi:hypothetical protein